VRILVTGASKAGKSWWINREVLGQDLLVTSELAASVLTDLAADSRLGCEACIAGDTEPRWQPLSPEEYRTLASELATGEQALRVRVRWSVPRLAPATTIHERPLHDPWEEIGGEPDAVVVVAPLHGLDAPSGRLLRSLCARLRARECRVWVVASRTYPEEADDPLEPVRAFLRLHLGKGRCEVLDGRPETQRWHAVP
jgi:hypothetical protein